MRFYLVTYQARPIGISGEPCGTTFNFTDACEVCGTGARVYDKLAIKNLGKSTPDFFQTLTDDFILSDKLYIAYKNEDMNPKLLKRVINIRKEELPFYHIMNETHLPKAKKINGLIVEDQCSVCKRNGYFNDIIMGDFSKGKPSKALPVQFYYSQNDFLTIGEADVTFSWECIGLSNRNLTEKKSIRYARPILVVSERFKLFLEKHKINKLKFEIVEYLD